MIESDFAKAGSFSCSDKDLNSIYDLNRYTFRCLDIGGYYGDCPQRERLGYGDGHVSVETGIYNFELGNFYKKCALNWISSQNTNGDIVNPIQNLSLLRLKHSKQSSPGKSKK